MNGFTKILLVGFLGALSACAPQFRPKFEKELKLPVVAKSSKTNSRRLALSAKRPDSKAKEVHKVIREPSTWPMSRLIEDSSKPEASAEEPLSAPADDSEEMYANQSPDLLLEEAQNSNDTFSFADNTPLPRDTRMKMALAAFAEEDPNPIRQSFTQTLSVDPAKKVEKKDAPYFKTKLSLIFFMLGVAAFLAAGFVLVQHILEKRRIRSLPRFGTQSDLHRLS